MHAIRHLLAQRRLAVLLCTATLLLKLLIPAGYMIERGHHGIAIGFCSGTAPVPMAMMPMPMAADVDDHGGGAGQGKAEMPCAYASLSAAVIAAIDPIQLAALLAFVLAIGLVGLLLPLPSRPTYLRPPLRAPPAYR